MTFDPLRCCCYCCIVVVVVCLFVFINMYAIRHMSDYVLTTLTSIAHQFISAIEHYSDTIIVHTSDLSKLEIFLSPFPFQIQAITMYPFVTFTGVVYQHWVCMLYLNCVLHFCTVLRCYPLTEVIYSYIYIYAYVLSLTLIFVCTVHLLGSWHSYEW